MAFLCCSKLVMIAGPLYFHIDQSLDMARAAAGPTSKEADS